MQLTLLIHVCSEPISKLDSDGLKRYQIKFSNALQFLCHVFKRHITFTWSIPELN